MSKILFVTSGLVGVTNASVEVVKRLRKDGHEVEYASPRSIGKRIDEIGGVFHKLDDILPDPSPEISVSGKLSRLVYKFRNQRKRKALAYERFYPSSFESLLKSVSYDLVVIDMEIHEYVILATHLGQKVVLLSQWFSIWKRKGLPYILSDVVAGEGLRGSDFGISVQWFVIQWKRKWLFFRRALTAGGTNRSSMIRMQARKTSFPSYLVGDNFWPGPFLFEDLAVLSMTSESIEFPHEIREGMKYLGPMVDDERLEIVEKGLKTFVETAKSKDLKLIYCSVSTLSKGDARFLKKIIEVGEQNPKWRIVISLGGKMEKDIFGEVSHNVLVCDRVPQLYMLKNADLSINHGGIHTINECIVMKVPILVYSGKHSDQNGCAARIHYHGIGLKADKDLDDAQEIANKIKEVLGSKKYLKNIEAAYEDYREIRDNKTVERIFNEYLLQEVPFA